MAEPVRTSVDVVITPQLQLSEETNRVIDALAAHKGILLPAINQLMAEAWAEGFNKGEDFNAWSGDPDDYKPDFTNPYTKEH